MKKQNHGSRFDDFLKDEGIYEEVHDAAVKSVIAWQVKQLMKDANLTKIKFANLAGTSRAQIDRLLDETNQSVTLKTLQKAAAVFDKQLEVRFV